MIGLSMKLVQRPPSAERLDKYIRNGIATGLTRTAGEGQQAVIGALKGTFTLRGNWFQPNMKYGIKRTMARGEKLEAVIGTNADWLVPHETGKNKTAQGGSVAVPTENVRRNKRLIIPRGQRPKGLAGKVFKLQSKRGPVLVQRITRGKNKGLRVLYGLERQVRIKRVNVFFDPINKVVKRRLNSNVSNAVEASLVKLASRPK